MSEGVMPKCRVVDFWDEQKTLLGQRKIIVRSWFRGQKVFDVEWTLLFNAL